MNCSTVNADKAVVEVTVTEATSPLTELEHVTTAIDLSFKAMTEIEEDHEGPEDLPVTAPDCYLFIY